MQWSTYEYRENIQYRKIQIKKIKETREGTRERQKKNIWTKEREKTWSYTPESVKDKQAKKKRWKKDEREF